MYYLILACVGVGIAIAGSIYLASLLYYKRSGVIAKAEVIDVAEVKKRVGVFSYIVWVGRRVNHYTHTLRYEVGGKKYEEKDRAAYSQPLKSGSTHLILCDPKKPERFKFEADVQKHITITAALVAMALLFAGRFLYEYMK